MDRSALVKGVVLLLPMLLGALLVFCGIWHGITVKRVKRWPQTEAVMLESEIRQAADDDYWLEVRYEYPVSGKTYQADRVSFRKPETESLRTAEAWQERYHVGARVLVSYDPHDPRRAFLEHGDHEFTVFATLFGAILILLPGAILVIVGAAKYGDKIFAFLIVPRLKKAHAKMQQAAVELQAVDQKLSQAALADADAIAADIRMYERELRPESPAPKEEESSASLSEEPASQLTEDTVSLTADPFAPPVGCDIVCEEQPLGLTFRVPARGILVGGCLPLFLGTGFCLAATILTLAAYINSAPLAEAIPFVGAFWLSGLGLLSWAVSLGRRQTGIAVSAERLAILQIGLIRRKQSEWSRAQIHFIDVASSGIVQNDEPLLELKILTRDGKRHGLMCERNELELRWIATRLRHVLGIPVTESDTLSCPNQATAEQPATTPNEGPNQPSGIWSDETPVTMNVLPMRFFASLCGTIVGAGSAALAAILMWYFIVRVDPRFQTQHLGGLAIGAIAGAILGGRFAYQGRSQQNYLVSICVRAVLLSGGWAFCQLAQQQEHRLAFGLFLVWGICLFGIGSLVIVADVLDGSSTTSLVWPSLMSNRKVLAFLVYSAFAASILLVSAYRSGERVLTFRRDDSDKQVNCVMETRRWFGSVQVGHSRLEGVQDWRRAFDEGDGMVLIAESGELFVEGDVSYFSTLAAKIEESLRDFLKSETPSLTLAETTAYPFWVHCLAAVLVVGIGVKFDPLVPWGTKWLIVNDSD